MTWYPMVVAAPVIGLAAYVLAHITFNWLTAGRRLLTGFVGGLLVGLTVQIVVTLAVLNAEQVAWSEGLALVIVNLFVFLGLADGYVHFVNILICSLRVRVLHELLNSADGLSEQEILARYNTGDLVGRRLQRLCHYAFLHRQEGRYFVRFSSLMLLAKIYQALKVFLLRKPATYWMAAKGGSSGDGALTFDGRSES